MMMCYRMDKSPPMYASCGKTPANEVSPVVNVTLPFTYNNDEKLTNANELVVYNKHECEILDHVATISMRLKSDRCHEGDGQSINLTYSQL
jgi:hypothetical protein